MEIAGGVTVNLYLLTVMVGGVGLISGFVGVSGGYLITPLLIIMGMPAGIAVGTGLALMTANSLIGILRHRQLGNLDLKMSLITAGGTMVGAELGVRLLERLQAHGEAVADIAVLGALLLTLIVVSIVVTREVIQTGRCIANGSEGDSAADDSEIRTAACDFLQSLKIYPHMRFTKSKLRISGWIIFVLGIGVGVLSGFLGIGGCFMRTPALIYLVGQPSVMTIGTNLLGSFFGLGFGAFRHAMLGNVEVGIALTMLLGMGLGTFIGAQGTSYFKGLAVRFVLAGSIIAACFGPAFKIAYFITDVAVLDRIARILTVGQIFMPVTMIVILLVLAARHRSGSDVPTWAESLLASVGSASAD